MTDTTDRAVQALAKKIADYLRDLVHAERPTQDVWWEALGLAVATPLFGTSPPTISPR